MRIEAYTQVQQLYQSQKVNKPQTTKKPSFADQLQLSSATKDVQSAKAAVAKTPDIREDVVAPIKERIKNGTYEVDINSFADKLMSNFVDK